MPFNNTIAGGNGQLVRNHLQSQNFVTGVSGWRLSKDGNLEANTGTFRGSLESGTDPGQHVILNNPATGDAFDVYNAANILVAYLNANGVFVAIDPSNGHLARMTQGEFQLNDGGTNDTVIQMIPAGSTALQTELDVAVSPHVGATYTLKLLGGSDDGSKLPTLRGNEQGVSGTIVQSSHFGLDSLICSGDVTGTTDAAGKLTVTHGAGFTPRAVFVQVHDTGTPTFGDVDVMNGSITSTTFQVFCTSFTGVTRASASVSFYYFCIK